MQPETNAAIAAGNQEAGCVSQDITDLLDRKAKPNADKTARV